MGGKKKRSEGKERRRPTICVKYICAYASVCHGLTVCVSVSRSQGQVACRQFIPVGPAQHSLHKNSPFLSLFFPHDSPAPPLPQPLRSICYFLPRFKSHFLFSSSPFLPLWPLSRLSLSLSTAEGKKKEYYRKGNLPIATNLVCDKEKKKKKENRLISPSSYLTETSLL